jgi:hypothetical protein
MTWALARAQLVTILEAATPATKPKGLAAFRHAPDSGEGKWGDSRTFRFDIEAGAARGPYPQGVAKRRRERVLLTVSYRHQTARNDLVDVIGEDVDTITKALLDEGEWDRPTSTIITLSLGEAELLPFVVEPTQGGTLLRFRFPLEHHT